jgi:Arc/MetJ family transcription regulator
MRTTLVLDDELVRQAKRRAAERKMTVSDVVNEALRESFRRRVTAARPFSVITYGRAGRRVRHEPSDFAAALDMDDREGLD